MYAVGAAAMYAVSSIIAIAFEGHAAALGRQRNIVRIPE
jgi:hypothetical protein